MELPDYTIFDLPKNPVKQLRETKQLNVAQLAKFTHLAIPTIRDVEKGLPATVPGPLKLFFDSQSLAKDYEDWKYMKRSCVFLEPVGLVSVSSDKHPFAQYREKLNITVAQLSEILCVPRFVIANYESGKQKKMPDVLKFFALPQAHLSEHDIARLANLGEIHYIAQEKKRINGNR